jgi:hypothetical protein
MENHLKRWKNAALGNNGQKNVLLYVWFVQ